MKQFVDFMEDNKSEDFGNWDFTQLELFAMNYTEGLKSKDI